VNCPDCGKELRPQGTTLADRPGTVLAGGRGLCAGDWKRHRQNGTLDQFPLLVRGDGPPRPPRREPEIDEARHRHNVAGAAAWHRERRIRLKMPNGDGSLDNAKPLKGLL
jgi:hypothetical protein